MSQMKTRHVYHTDTKKQTALFMLREEKNLSQDDVAKSLKISRSAYINYENGRDIPSSILIKLSKLYKISTDFLLELSDCRSVDNEYIRRKTGLSDKAIEILHNAAEPNPKLCVIVSDLIENGELLEEMKKLRLGHRIKNNPGSDLIGLSSDKAFSDSIRSGELDLWEHIKTFCEL